VGKQWVNEGLHDPRKKTTMQKKPGTLRKKTNLWGNMFGIKGLKIGVPLVG